MQHKLAEVGPARCGAVCGAIQTIRHQSCLSSRSRDGIAPVDPRRSQFGKLPFQNILF